MPAQVPEPFVVSTQDHEPPTLEPEKVPVQVSGVPDPNVIALLEIVPVMLPDLKSSGIPFSELTATVLQEPLISSPVRMKFHFPLMETVQEVPEVTPLLEPLIVPSQDSTVTVVVSFAMLMPICSPDAVRSGAETTPVALTL